MINLCVSVRAECPTVVHAIQASSRPFFLAGVLLSLVVIRASREVEHLVLRVLVLLPPEEDEAAEEATKEENETKTDHSDEADQERGVGRVGSDEPLVGGGQVPAPVAAGGVAALHLAARVLELSTDVDRQPRDVRLLRAFPLRHKALVVDSTRFWGQVGIVCRYLY